MQIIVTEEHIKNGVPDDCGRCPVALALRENGINLRVGYEGLYNFLTIKPLYTISEKVHKFLTDFDNNTPVSKTVFEFNEETKELV